MRLVQVVVHIKTIIHLQDAKSFFFHFIFCFVSSSTQCTCADGNSLTVFSINFNLSYGSSKLPFHIRIAVPYSDFHQVS